MFAGINKMPPTGLKTEKAQAEDMLEGFRRPEEDRQAAMFGDVSLSIDRARRRLPRVEKSFFGAIAAVGEMRRKAFAYLSRKVVGNTYTNQDTGLEIAVPKSGIKKTLSHSSSVEDILATALIPQMLETGRLKHVDADRKGRAEIKSVKKFEADFKIGDDVKTAVIIVRQAPDGHWFYDQTIKKESDGYAGDHPSHEAKGQSPRPASDSERVATNGMSPSLETSSDTSETLRNPSDKNIPPSSEGVKASEKLTNIIKEIERIAAPGVKVEAKDRITLDLEQRKVALEKWGEGADADVKIRGAHRVVSLDGEGFRSLIEFSLENMAETTLYHEAFHSVQEFLLTDEEMRRLEERFPDRDGVSSHERQAEAFAQYAAACPKEKKRSNNVHRRRVNLFILLNYLISPCLYQGEVE